MTSGPLAGTAAAAKNDEQGRGRGAQRVMGHVGIGAWTFIGVVIAVAIVVAALSVIAEVVIPIALAALLAVVFKPSADRLVRRGWHPAFAAGLVVVGLGALVGGIAAASVAGISSQSEEIHSAVDDAVHKLADESGINTESIQNVRTAVNESSALLALGSVTQLVSGVNTLVGLASGILLGSLVLYYLVKDGRLLRTRFVLAVKPTHRAGLNKFIGDACATLRSYGRGRTVMSGIVAAVIGLAAILLGLPLITVRPRP